LSVVREEFRVVAVNVNGVQGEPTPQLSDCRRGADGVADAKRGAPDRDLVTTEFLSRWRQWVICVRYNGVVAHRFCLLIITCGVMMF
jgi:hypothetical protein